MRQIWIRAIIAVGLGNVIYFLMSPYLPLAAQNAAAHLDLGTLVDFWICLAIYGLLGATVYFRRRPPS